MLLFTSVRPVFRTIDRKIRKSLRQRGFRRTVGRCITKPYESARHHLAWLTPSYRRHLRSERAFDEQYGVNTVEQLHLGWLGGIDSGNWEHDAGYRPAPVGPISDLLTRLPIAYEDFVFVDFGSGKGRVVLLASQHPFKRVVGVEYSRELHNVAVHNTAKVRNLQQRSPLVESTCQDATDFVIPNEPLVLFFHHPFDEAVFQRVVSRIVASLDLHPRPLYVIYYDPKCAHLFERGPFRVCWQNEDEFIVYEAVGSAAVLSMRSAS